MSETGHKPTHALDLADLIGNPLLQFAVAFVDLAGLHFQLISPLTQLA